MKQSQSGFTLIETIIASSLVILMAATIITVVQQIVQDTQQTNAHMSAVFYADMAGFWIGRDVKMADSLDTENITPPELLTITWTDWGYDDDSIYHTVTYSIEDVSVGIGKLKRTHEDSNGGSQETTIAECIYYDPDDPDNTTQVTRENTVLILKVATSCASAEESREYTFYCRPNY